MNIRLLFVHLALIGSLVSCQSNRERDSIEVVEEFTDLEDFSRLKIEGIFNLNLVQGDQPFMSIKGSQELVELFEVSQRGDLLKLSVKEGKDRKWKNKGLQVDLTVPDLKELAFDGAGNIKTKGTLELSDFRIVGNGVGNINLNLEAESIMADLNLVGKLTLSGATDYFNLHNEGIGNIDASSLYSSKVDIESSGIGAVAVHCKEELNINASGIGSISYSGNPTTVNEKVSGLGKVTRN